MSLTWCFTGADCKNFTPQSREFPACLIVDIKYFPEYEDQNRAERKLFENDSKFGVPIRTGGKYGYCIESLRECR